MARIKLRVKPGCKQLSHLEKQDDGSYIAFLHARAHDGEANKELFELISKEFKVAKTSLVLVSGAKSREKVIEW